jgi:zinc protease
MVSLSAETHAEHRGDTVVQFLEALEELADRGPSDEALDAARTFASDQWAQPDAAMAHMDTVALGVLFGLEDPLYQRFAEDMAGLTRESIATGVRAVLDGAFVIIPAGCDSALPRRYRGFRTPDVTPVHGASARFRYAPIGDQYRLTFGADGVTHWDADGHPATIRFDACAGVVAWRDGSRLLYGNDGTTLELRPESWKRYDAVRACVDDHAPQPVARVDRAPTTAPDWILQARRWRLRRIWSRFAKEIVVACAVVAVGVEVLLVDPTGIGPYGILVVAGYFLWGLYQATRKR